MDQKNGKNPESEEEADEEEEWQDVDAVEEEQFEGEQVEEGQFEGKQFEGEQVEEEQFEEEEKPEEEENNDENEQDEEEKVDGEREKEEPEEDKEPEIPEVLTLKEYLLFESLLPDPDQWKHTIVKYKRRRIRFLFIVLITYLTLWLLNIAIYVTRARRLTEVQEMRKSMLKRLEIGKTLPQTCIVLDCVTICPEESTVPDWYTLYELPYATLPQKKAYFTESMNPYSFGDCYLAYWRSVSKMKREFTNGKLIFHGLKISDPNYECAQMLTKNREESPAGNPHSCLTLSFHYPYCQNKTKLPVVVYIGGEYMLKHRPQLISAKMASELGIIYVTVGYRLGVFGFSDFNTIDSKTNNGVRDIKKALIWIQENIHHFNGDASRVTIYGENSGATIGATLLQLQNSADIIVNNRKMQLFSRLWLSDGSLYIPKHTDQINPFQELVLHDFTLNTYCDAWKSGSTKQQTFNHPLRLKFHCLRDVPIHIWLQKTPSEWLQSRHIDQNDLPQADEQRFSIIKNDGDMVTNPVGALYRDQLEFQSTSIRDMPLVLFSSLGHECAKTCAPNQFERWSFDQLHTTIITEMDKFQAHNRQAPTGNAIWNLYQHYIKQTIHDLEFANKLSQFSYKVIYDEIRRDLRGNCLYTMYAKYLVNSRQIEKNPVYRILNRVPRVAYVDGLGNRCDIPFFLIDSEFSCGHGTHPVYTKVIELEMKAMVDLFTEFVRYGEISTATRMVITDDISKSIAYNIVDDLDLTSPGGREIDIFQLCEAWFSENSGELFAARHSRLN